MTPLIHIRKKDKAAGWINMDLRDIEGVEAVIVIPLFGRDHHMGFDCWCRPTDEDGVISHHQHH
jgi:hypothetical protein